MSQSNYLKLPEQIQIAMDGLNHIKYLYSTTGIKLAKQTMEDGVPQHTIDYVGSFVYENDVLLHLLIADPV